MCQSALFQGNSHHLVDNQKITALISSATAKNPEITNLITSLRSGYLQTFQQSQCSCQLSTVARPQWN